MQKPKHLTKVFLSQKFPTHLTPRTRQPPSQHLLFNKISTHDLCTLCVIIRQPYPPDEVLGTNCILIFGQYRTNIALFQSIEQQNSSPLHDGHFLGFQMMQSRFGQTFCRNSLPPSSREILRQLEANHVSEGNIFPLLNSYWLSTHPNISSPSCGSDRSQNSVSLLLQ